MFRKGSSPEGPNFDAASSKFAPLATDDTLDPEVVAPMEIQQDIKHGSFGSVGAGSKEKRKRSPIHKTGLSRSPGSQSPPQTKVIVREEQRNGSPTGTSPSFALIVYPKGPARKEVWRAVGTNPGSPLGRQDGSPTTTTLNQAIPLPSSHSSILHQLHHVLAGMGKKQDDIIEGSSPINHPELHSQQPTNPSDHQVASSSTSKEPRGADGTSFSS